MLPRRHPRNAQLPAESSCHHQEMRSAGRTTRAPTPDASARSHAAGRMPPRTKITERRPSAETCLRRVPRHRHQDFALVVHPPEIARAVEIADLARCARGDDDVSRAQIHHPLSAELESFFIRNTPRLRFWWLQFHENSLPDTSVLAAGGPSTGLSVSELAATHPRRPFPSPAAPHPHRGSGSNDRSSIWTPLGGTV